LAPEDLVSPGDVSSLASKLIEVLRDPGRMDAMAARNLRRAADFQEDFLDGRRCEFLREVRRITARWLDASAGGQRLKQAEVAGC
jgi:hypothetical protein